MITNNLTEEKIKLIHLVCYETNVSGIETLCKYLNTYLLEKF